MAPADYLTRLATQLAGKAEQTQKRQLQALTPRVLKYRGQDSTLICSAQCSSRGAFARRVLGGPPDIGTSGAVQNLHPCRYQYAGAWHQQERDGHSQSTSASP